MFEAFPVNFQLQGINWHGNDKQQVSEEYEL